jgi:hypothetical protein
MTVQVREHDKVMEPYSRAAMLSVEMPPFAPMTGPASDGPDDRPLGLQLAAVNA